MSSLIASFCVSLVVLWVPRAMAYSLDFALQHEYQLDGSNQLSFSTVSNIPHPDQTVKAVPTTVYRPASSEAYHRARRRSIVHSESESVSWNKVDMLGPDIQDQATLIQLARMAGNAYASFPGRNNWYEVDWNWNSSTPYGWEDSNDGFRGHVFFSSDNSTIVLSIKGTTLQGPTSQKDKYNDNLLFSCCCARVDVSWIFNKALIEDSLFYTVGVNLVANLTELYPDSHIWLVGHSLGGALASLLGSTFGLPAVAFESPGERLAASRLHLPLPPASLGDSIPLTPVTHIYHTADPIAQGACTGMSSPCTAAGFALETRCHLGKTVLYDTVGRLGWHVDIRTHRIGDIITRLLEVEEEWEEGRSVPSAQEEGDCMECYKWEFGDFK